MSLYRAFLPAFSAAGLVTINAADPDTARLHAAAAFGFDDDADLSAIYLTPPGAPLDLSQLAGVPARNAVRRLTSITDVESVLAHEEAGPNRTLVTEACRSTLRRLGRSVGVVVPDPVAMPATLPVVTPAAVSADARTCPKCATGATPSDVDAVFGHRNMRRTRKDGSTVSVLVPQSYCKRCRSTRKVAA